MTESEAFELGDQNGFDDGFDGNAYVSYNGTVPQELYSVYEKAYHDSYADGEEAYRRMIDSR